MVLFSKCVFGRGGVGAKMVETVITATAMIAVTWRSSGNSSRPLISGYQAFVQTLSMIRGCYQLCQDLVHELRWRPCSSQWPAAQQKRERDCNCKKNLKLFNRCCAREWKWNDWERNSWKCLNHRERYLWTRSEKYWKDCERNSWKWLNQWRRSREWGSALELGAKQQNQTMPPPPWGSTGHGYI